VLAREQLFCKLKHWLVRWGLQMCCFVGWLFYFIFQLSNLPEKLIPYFTQALDLFCFLLFPLKYFG